MNSESRAKNLKTRQYGRGRELIFRVLTVALSTLATLTVVEVALRIFLPSSDLDLFVYRADSIRHKLMKPNIAGHVYGVRFETNEQGFRAEKPYRMDKGPNTLRILVLGDSFTVCAGVPFSGLTTTLLEKRLDSRFPQHEVEVYNLAVAGHGILHHLATLQEIGVEYDPDLILLCLFPINDFEAYAYDVDKALALTGGRNEKKDIRTRAQQLYLTKVFWYRTIFVLRKISFVDRMLGSNFGFPKVLKYLEAGSVSRERSEEALREIADLTRKAATPVQVFLLPTTYGETFDEQRKIHDMAAQICDSAGLPTVSLLDRFESSGEPPRAFALNIIDSHPNTAYCSLAEEIIFATLGDGVLSSLNDGMR